MAIWSEIGLTNSGGVLPSGIWVEACAVTGIASMLPDQVTWNCSVSVETGNGATVLVGATGMKTKLNTLFFLEVFQQPGEINTCN